MANQVYSSIAIAINGALLLEEAKVSFKRSTGSSPVFTNLRGYAGESVGAPMLEAEVSGGVPVAGIEFNPGTRFKSLEPVEITFYLANKRLTSKGVIYADSYDHSVNSEINQSFSFRGEPADFEDV